MKKIILILILFFFLFGCNNSICGDGICDKINEGKIVCPEDCDPNYEKCGDGKITGNENCENCPEDVVCGEGFECIQEKCIKIKSIECEEDEDCGTGFQCKSNKCIKVLDLCLEINCDDGNPCTLNKCDELTGNCLTQLKPDKTICGENKECFSGECISVIYCEKDEDCDDGIKCTKDKCTDSNKCVYSTQNHLCSDGIDCTIDECTLNGCTHSLNHFACNDGINCTKDYCTLNGCTHIPQNNKCDDGIDCTLDKCLLSGCSHIFMDSNCFNPPFDCFKGTCTLQGCVYSPNDSLCISSDLCEIGKCTAENGCEFELMDCGQPDLFCEQGTCVYLSCEEIAEKLGEPVVLCSEGYSCSGDWRPSYEGENNCCKGTCVSIG